MRVSPCLGVIIFFVLYFVILQHAFAQENVSTTTEMPKAEARSPDVGVQASQWNFPPAGYMPRNQTSIPVSADATSGSSSSANYLANHATSYTPVNFGQPVLPQPKILYATTTTKKPEYYSQQLSSDYENYPDASSSRQQDYYVPKRVEKKPKRKQRRRPSAAPPKHYYTEDDGVNIEDIDEDHYLGSGTDQKPATSSPTDTGYYKKSSTNAVSSETKHKGSETGDNSPDSDKVAHNYVAAGSDAYHGYGGGYSDYGLPDYHHHHHPYHHHYPPYHHHHHKSSSKGPIALLLGLLPLGLLMASLVPSFVSLPVGAVGTVAAAGRRRRSTKDEKPGQTPLYVYKNPVLGAIAKFGVQNLDDPQCLQQIFCQITTDSKVPETTLIRKAFITMSGMLDDRWSERLGLDKLFKSLRTGECSMFKCANNEKSSTTKTVIKGNTTTKKS